MIDTPHAGPLERRFREHLGELLRGAPPPHLLVALSGGCDSVVLLYLLRSCAPGLALRLSAAHLDHAMRPGSREDALWVRGLCSAWGVELVSATADGPLSGEAAAREARYRFLRRAAADAGADLVATAHHADDQAETVLFRILRGTGLEGLSGMAPLSEDAIVRPLLPYWRREIEAFARERGLRWRTDPTNLRPEHARNRIRLEILPLIERTVAPSARQSLVSLARLAEEAEGALGRQAEAAEAAVARWDGGVALLARNRLRDYDSAIGSRILRNVLRRFGVILGRPGTRTALQFITRAPSGRELQLPRGVRVRLEFDTARVERVAGTEADRPLVIDGYGADVRAGTARIGGRRWRVEWRAVRAVGNPPPETGALLPLAPLRFPLMLRGWRPGDRMRTAGGTKSLKKLFLEARIPLSRRSDTAVLADAAETVWWVAGIARRPPEAPGAGEEALFLTVVDD
jgi:tRNA(Ile)-lysidine synthase